MTGQKEPHIIDNDNGEAMMVTVRADACMIR